MAGVVFEKQLSKIQEGLNALRKMEDSLTKLQKINKKPMFNLASKNIMLLQKGIKEITKRNNDLAKTNSIFKSIEYASYKLDFAKSNKGIDKFNSSLSKTQKIINDLVKKSKKVGLIGGGAAGVIGGGASYIANAIANFGKGYVADNFNANQLGIKNNQYQALLNVSELASGNKNLLTSMLNHINTTKASVESNSHLANLGINQSDWQVMDWKQQIQKLLDISSNKDFDKFGMDYLHEAIESISGVDIATLRSLNKEIPNFNKALNNALKDVSNNDNLQKMINLGKEKMKLDSRLESFGIDSASGINKGLTNAMQGIGKGFNELRNDSTYKALLGVTDSWLSTNINQKRIGEAISNLPAMALSGMSSYNKIESFFKSLSANYQNTRNSLNDVFAKFGVTDPTNYNDKSNAIKSQYEAIQADIKALELASASEDTRLRNALKFGNKYNVKEAKENLAKLESELREMNKLKVEFTIKHEYDNGKWHVKETKAKEPRNLGSIIVTSIDNSIKGLF